MKILLSAVTLMLAFAATAAVTPLKLSCRGSTAPSEEARVEHFVYSLGDRDRWGSTVVVWSRTVTTRVEPNGRYCVMLSDDSGSAPKGELADVKLVDALAKIKGTPELIVKDSNGQEIDRTALTTLREAQVAATTHAVDVVGVENAKVNVTGSLDAYELYAGSLTVGSKTTLPGTCVFVPMKERFVGGAEKTEIVVKNVQTEREAWPSIVASKREEYQNMPCDLVVTYDRPMGNGAYNVIVPFQGTLPAPKKDVQAVAETAFGGL